MIKMKKLTIIGMIVLAVFVVACTPKVVLYKGIEGAEITGSCVEHDDVCGLFACMVDLCWCDSGNVLSPVLHEGDTVITLGEDAMKLTEEYFPEDYTVTGAKKINTVFYNIFAEDEEGNEEVLTVAVDGTVIKTQCGV